MRNNKKGVSFVELVIVMGMLAALMSVTAISFSSAWRARASKAANTADALLSQSKVNALSGDNNYFQITFHEKDNSKGYRESAYYAELFKTGSSEPYKSEVIGNGRLEILFDDEVIANDEDSGEAIKVKFNQKTGAVEYAGKVSLTDTPDSAPKECQIKFHFGNTYTIRLWKVTGEHNIA